MKTNYDKYIEEVWENKDQVYKDFLKSGYEHFTDFIKNEIKDINPVYHLKAPHDVRDLDKTSNKRNFNEKIDFKRDEASLEEDAVFEKP
jgi:hypothetical protein